MTELKSITAAGVPAALQKAERYRLLNDSSAAESICQDVLAVDPTNQTAAVTLLLSITDQFDSEPSARVGRAREVLSRLDDEYQRKYYAGIIAERAGKALLRRDGMGSRQVASEWLREAMARYEEAERLRPEKNDSSILRWNTCARLLARHGVPEVEREYEPVIGE